MSPDIADYKANYFLPAAREVLDRLLADHGFSYAGDHRGVSAYWVADGQFFRVGYLPETKPNYELLMGVGESEGSPLEPKSSSNSVGVWRLLPPEVAGNIVDWRFDSPQALKDGLRRAWTEAIVPYVVPVWSDRDRLARAIEEHNDELTNDD